MSNYNCLYYKFLCYMFTYNYMYNYMNIHTSIYIYLCFKLAFKNLKLIHIVLEVDIDLLQ